MAETILQAILETSMTAGISAIVVTLIRIPMKKLPKKWSYMLWAVVFFRCLCPFSAESAVSIFNVIPGQIVSEQSISMKAAQVSEAVYGIYSVPPAAEYHYGITQNTYGEEIYKDYSGNAAFNKEDAYAVSGTAGTKKTTDLNFIIFTIWATGVLTMIWYAVVSYALLMQKVRAAVKTPDGVYETDLISTAFTAGFFPPKIFLPCGLSENERRLITAHEKVHIRRLDFIIKPLAFAGLALHWFNPLIWAAFALMTRDMEFSCDEAVMELLGSEEKEDYSEALLMVSMKKSRITAIPTAFAEIGVKNRVKNVLEYKKPGIFGTVFAALIVVSSCAVLGTNAVNVPAVYGNAVEISEVSITNIAEESSGFTVIFQEQEAISNTAEEIASDDGSEYYSYAVYASDAGYSEKTYDVLISYPDGTIEEFSVAEDQLFEFPDLGSVEISEAVADAFDTGYLLDEDTIWEYSSTGEFASEYPVYITVAEALSSAQEAPVLYASGEYTMCILYEPYGMYYDYQKNCYIYNGEPVRFFNDPVMGVSFTNYFTGTIDLEAVYENDILVGITECSDEAYAIHDEKQMLFSAILPGTSIVVLPDASLVMAQ